MADALETAIREANYVRYRPGQEAGHYESFFLRANHPERPLAYWIRYTVFSPEGPDSAVVAGRRDRPSGLSAGGQGVRALDLPPRPQSGRGGQGVRAPIGELWAVVFDGETGRHVAVKTEVPIGECAFGPGELGVRVAGGTLRPGAAQGAASSGGHSISWDLTFGGAGRPLFLLPLPLYAPELPRAKSLVPAPMASFSGVIRVDENEIDVSGWAGSQNHNWGPRHTDHYAWGQVAGFGNDGESFLELATARFRAGDSWTPFATPIVLRRGDEEFALNTLPQAAAAEGSFTYFNWDFASESQDIALRGRIWAPKEAFVGLAYYNPPGGTKHCLNTKIASCDLQVTDKRSGKQETLRARNRAAFEILTDDAGHGVEIRV